MLKVLLNLLFIFYISSTQAQSLVTAEVFHGNDSQQTSSVTTDSDNNIICSTGFWDDLDADPGPGTLNFNAVSSQDVAITKLDPSGNLIWSKQLGGTGFETPMVVKADASNNVYVFGYFNGTLDMNPGPGVTNLVSAGSDDLYVGKYDPNGTLLWAVRTGGTGTEQSYGFDLDASGNAVVHGYFQNTIDFDPGPGTANLTAAFAGSTFLLKLNGDGTYASVLLMASFYTNKIDVDASNNVYFTGLFWETVDFDPGPATHNLSATDFSADAFVFKLNSSNVYQWANKISGASSEQGTSIVYDPTSSSVIVGGFFEGTIDINPGPVVQNLVTAGYVDAFIAKFNGGDGTLAWGESIGGLNFESIYGVAVSATGSIWLTGTFVATTDFDPGVAVFNVTTNGSNDIFKLNLANDGSFIGVEKIGGTSTDIGAWVNIDNEGAVLICGLFEGLVDFDPGVVTFNLNSLFTGYDGFIAKYCTVYTINNYVSICEGESYFAAGANQTEPGDYYDYFTPVEGCDSIIITHLSVNNPVVNLGPNTAICSGSVLTLNAGNPGATYVWSTGATTQTINVTTAGTYSVTITDLAGCTATDAITITVNPAPNVNLGADINACADETIILNAGNPGSTYLWSTGATTQTIIANISGTYSVTVTNGFGCIDVDVINVVIHALPTVNIGNLINYCAGETISLDAGNIGSTYLWNTGATTQTISTTFAGTYSVVVTNAFGCDASDNATLIENAAPIVNLGADIIVCADEIITLNAANVGSTYLWNTGATTQTITVTESGNYNVIVTNAFGCDGNDLITVTINPLPIVNLGTTIDFCENTTILLDAENTGSTYLWNNGATTQTITTAMPGTYSVTVTNAFGCDAYDEVIVNALPAPEINLGMDTGFCVGSSFIIDATTPDVSYLWNTGATSSILVVDESGNYSVTLTNFFGCTTVDSIHIESYITPIVSLGDDNAFCTGEEVLLDATNIDCTYLWNTGATTSTLYVTESGSYSVTVTNAFGCTAYDDINITINPLPVADLGADTTICEGHDVLLDATTPFCSYLWNIGATSATILASEAGLYSVAITNSFGCLIIDSIYVNILPAPEVSFNLPFTEICSNAEPIILTGGLPTGGLYSGDAVIDGIFDPATAGIGTHELMYTFTDVNSCEGIATQTITVTVCQAINTNEVSNILVYPNPTLDNITIQNNSNGILQQLTIINLQGEIVLTKNIMVLPNATINLSVAQLPSGTYVIKLMDNYFTTLVISK